MLFEKRKRLIKGTTEVMVSSDLYQTLFLLSVLYINMKDTGNKSVIVGVYWKCGEKEAIHVTILRPCSIPL